MSFFNFFILRWVAIEKLKKFGMIIQLCMIDRKMELRLSARTQIKNK